MHTNCYSQASNQNYHTTVGFSKTDFLYGTDI